jgi:hypothetical protein
MSIDALPLFKPRFVVEDEQMTRYERRPDALCTTLPDGTGVVLHLEKRCYYPLSKSGVFLWGMFDGSRVVDVDELSAALVARYGIPLERARVDVATFVERLVAERILVGSP